MDKTLLLKLGVAVVAIVALAATIWTDAQADAALYGLAGLLIGWIGLPRPGDGNGKEVSP